MQLKNNILYLIIFNFCCLSLLKAQGPPPGVGSGTASTSSTSIDNPLLEEEIDTSEVSYFFSDRPNQLLPFRDTLLNDYFHQYDPTRKRDFDFGHLGNLGSAARPLVWQPVERDVELSGRAADFPVLRLFDDRGRQVFRVEDLGIPRIHFGVGTAELLPDMHSAGADVVGVDFRLPLSEAAHRVPGAVLQGNLDPAVLFAPWEAVERQVRQILLDAEGLPGHIFNLGHGVLPSTNPDVLQRVVDLVHELTAR